MDSSAIDFEKTNYVKRGAGEMNWESYQSVETVSVSES